MRNIRISLMFATAALLAVSASTAKAELVYGLNGAGNNIFTFDSLNPSRIISAKFITNFSFANEEITAIDVRPATNALYAVSSRGVLYTLSSATGALTVVGTITGTTMDGTNFDTAFNPTNDTLRLGSDTTMNAGINPTTAVATPGTAFNLTNGAPVNIAGLAYSNNVPTAITTTLYGLDATSNDLVTIAGPAGTVTTIGGTGIDFTDLAGFDISNTTIAYAALQPVSSSISDLYAVNLTTGLVNDLGQIGGGEPVRDIALVNGGGVSATQLPEPATLGLLAMGIPALLMRRRKA